MKHVEREAGHRVPDVTPVRQTRPAAVPWGAAPGPGIFGGMTEQKNEPENTKDPGARGQAGSCGVILPLRSGYPSPGCVPAEPGSVSPDRALYLTLLERFKTDISASGSLAQNRQKRLPARQSQNRHKRLPARPLPPAPFRGPTIDIVVIIVTHPPPHSTPCRF
jgi:hypothetical protein